MKQSSMIKKVMAVIMIIVIIAGIIITVVKGFNFDLKYEATDQIQIHIEKEFNNNDVRQIAKEVLQTDRILIQKVEMFEDTVAITAFEITDEQKNAIIEKINEKYELKYKAEDITIEQIPHTRARDIMKPYVMPMIVATVITILYLAIRYYKLGVFKTIFKAGGIAVLAQLLLFSIIAIARIPIGRITIPVMLVVYVVSMIWATTKFEKQLEEKNKELEEKEKEKEKEE